MGYDESGGGGAPVIGEPPCPNLTSKGESSTTNPVGFPLQKEKDLFVHSSVRPFCFIYISELGLKVVY